MSYETSFNVIALDELTEAVKQRKADGWRYVQTLAVNTEAGVDLIYSFMKGASLENLTIKAVGKGDIVKSITDEYLAAFVWENEINDLFGVKFDGIAIDFAGCFYGLSQSEPMTVISPAQLAAREKAKKIAAAKAAKAAGAKADEKPAQKADAEMEAKLAAMDPEKAAKVRAAMEAKAKKEAAKKAEQEAAELEAKLAAMDPDKAAKVRAAMAAKAAKAAAKKEGE